MKRFMFIIFLLIFVKYIDSKSINNKSPQVKINVLEDDSFEIYFKNKQFKLVNMLLNVNNKAFSLDKKNMQDNVLLVPNIKVRNDDVINYVLMYEDEDGNKKSNFGRYTVKVDSSIKKPKEKVVLREKRQCLHRFHPGQKRGTFDFHGFHHGPKRSTFEATYNIDFDPLKPVKDIIGQLPLINGFPFNKKPTPYITKPNGPHHNHHHHENDRDHPKHENNFHHGNDRDYPEHEDNYHHGPDRYDSPKHEGNFHHGPHNNDRDYPNHHGPHNNDRDHSNHHGPHNNDRDYPNHHGPHNNDREHPNHHGPHNNDRHHPKDEENYHHGSNKNDRDTDDSRGDDKLNLDPYDMFKDKNDLDKNRNKGQTSLTSKKYETTPLIDVRFGNDE